MFRPMTSGELVRACVMKPEESLNRSSSFSATLASKRLNDTLVASSDCAMPSTNTSASNQPRPEVPTPRWPTSQDLSRRLLAN